MDPRLTYISEIRPAAVPQAGREPAGSRAAAPTGARPGAGLCHRVSRAVRRFEAHPVADAIGVGIVSFVIYVGLVFLLSGGRP